jgi:hypothetical protein
MVTQSYGQHHLAGRDRDAADTRRRSRAVVSVNGKGAGGESADMPPDHTVIRAPRAESTGHVIGDGDPGGPRSED